MNKRQEVSKIVNILPRKGSDHQIFIEMTKKTQNNKAFKINADRILEALKWLKENNPHYTDIVIDTDEIERL